MTLTSCSVLSLNDIFSHYSKQMAPVRDAQLSGNYSAAYQALPERSLSDNRYYLLKAEKARLRFLNQQWLSSQNTFLDVINYIKKENDKPSLQLSRTLDNVGAAFSNDNATRYDFPWYEQIMSHSYQALNYTFQNNLEAALVEVRTANLLQARAFKKNEEEIIALKEKLSSYKLSPEDINRHLPSMHEAIGKLKFSFQNAFTFYLSGLLYEVSNEPNDAYIDYKKALELVPNNITIQKDVLRLAKKLSMTNDITYYSEQYPNILALLNEESNAEDSKGQVVVLIEQGVVAPKQQVKLNVPINRYGFDLRLLSFALPVYQNSLEKISAMTLTVNDKSYQETPIIRLQSLAAKQLEEELPLIVVRQALRLISKERLRANIANSGGELGNLVASLYNASSEQADTRSWSTLPDSIGLIKTRLPVGEHQVIFSNNKLVQDQKLTIKVNNNRLTLINIWLINGKYHSKVTYL